VVTGLIHRHPGTSSAPGCTFARRAGSVPSYLLNRPKWGPPPVTTVRDDPAVAKIIRRPPIDLRDGHDFGQVKESPGGCWREWRGHPRTSARFVQLRLEARGLVVQPIWHRTWPRLRPDLGRPTLRPTPACGHLSDVRRPRRSRDPLRTGQTANPAPNRTGKCLAAGFDEAVLTLYAKGMTTGDIAAHLADVYGGEVSRDLVSQVTDAVLADMADWHPGRMVD
jgi:hypothetical protein